MLDIERTALAFDRACRAAGVPYAFMGGMAVSAWGQPRATSDVDALIFLASPRAGEFADLLQREGLTVDPRDLAEALSDGGHVTVFDEASVFHVDCKMATTPAERAELASAREIPYEGATLRVVAPEETLAFKLLFGSAQDLQDARSILIRQEGRLDLARLRGLARELRVENALDALLADP